MAKEIDNNGIEDTWDDKFFTIYKDLINSKRNINKRFSLRPERVEDVATEFQRIKNDGLKQDMKMKKITLWILFGFLAVETVAIFFFAFFQGIERPWGFRLEEWSFRLLVTATISQVTTMLIIAVRHLFPNNN